MYERKIPIDFSCGLRLTMSFLSSKWKPCILEKLRNGPRRPSELHRAMTGATPRVLNLQLKELEEDGLVSKMIYPELPPRSEYAITDLGRSLLPIIESLTLWGEEHRAQFESKINGKGE